MAPRSVLLLAGVFVAFLAAACEGSSGPRVATIGTVPAAVSTTTATAAAKWAAFYACMASHGFPDYRVPSRKKGGRITLTPAQVSESQSPGFQAAQKKCATLMPGFGGGLTPAREAVARAHALEFSRCARAHGMPSFPDPTSVGALDLSAAGIDPESPAFLRAKQDCAKFLGDGLVFLVQPPG